MLARSAFAGLVSFTLSACAVTPSTFYDDPQASGDTSLCRAYYETEDDAFAQDVAEELRRRRLTDEDCRNKIQSENTALVVSAIAVGTVATVAACSGGGCGGGGYTQSSRVTDYDCAGGVGDGPLYVRGPFRLTGPDVYGLDRDRDGIACETYDDFGS